MAEETEAERGRKEALARRLASAEVVGDDGHAPSVPKSRKDYHRAYMRGWRERQAKKLAAERVEHLAEIERLKALVGSGQE